MHASEWHSPVVWLMYSSVKAYFTITSNTKDGGAEVGVDGLVAVFEAVVCVFEVVSVDPVELVGVVSASVPIMTPVIMW